jgi:predicted RecA/RadA family phage recombinase
MQNEIFYRGDDLTAPVAALISANTIAGNPVQSGDACVMGDIVGIATTSAAPLANAPAYTGYNGVPATQLALRVKGIFSVTVHPAAAVLPGAPIYIDPVTGILSDNNAKTFFGYYVPTTNVNLNAGADNPGTPVKLKGQ